MDVLSLLRSKNRCLQRFLETSTEFLEQAEKTGQLPDVLILESQRDAILKAIDLYDRKIREAIVLMGTDRAYEVLPRDLTGGIKTALERKSQLVHRILLLDDRILALIDAEKSKVLKELSSAHRQEGITKKFKSTWVAESGEGIDEKL